ncbi:HAD family hydrolase [Alicyclobacillus fastidiosus]|uniref:HAD family hydrolase n=1 Tax=Alicyclobacillus fastidiosus TaxID=392011 RepID=A0ABV5AD66_9BACL|nr:HAD family hydrolase [Alicyclobacillus fastidiosus]WEH08759.1 HAD family hydrolase [Alicyclobacillus fastidiosus]
MTTRWLISTDLDGTLLHPDGRPSQRAKDVFARLHEAGHVIVLASGRHWDHMVDIASFLDVPCYVVASNGAWIGRPDGQSFVSRLIAVEYVEKLERAMRGLPAVVIVTTKDDRLILRSGDPVVRERETWSAKVVDSIGDADIYKLTVMMDESVMDQVQLRLQQAFAGEPLAFARTDERTVDINAAGTSKGQAISVLADRLGIAKGHTIAFGNEMNDAGMLSTAGIGVAVKDANPDLLAYADTRTHASYEDGVAAWLEAFFVAERVS